MKTDLVQQTPLIRCHKCGSPDVTVYCHHCGKPMCSSHGPVKPGQYWFTENREFDGFSMNKWPLLTNQGAHCESCAHSNLNLIRILIIPGILATLIGVYLLLTNLSSLLDCINQMPPPFNRYPALFSEALRDPDVYRGVEGKLCYLPFLVGQLPNLITGLAITGIGIATIISGNVLRRQRKLWESAGEKSLPVHLGPVTNQLQVVESLTATFSTGSDQQIRATLNTPITGTILSDLRFTPMDIRRVAEYRQKYTLKPNADLRYSAGYLAIHPTSNQVVSSYDARSSSLYQVFPLHGHTSEQPYLNETKGMADSIVVQPFTYTFYPNASTFEDWNQVPVRIIPLLTEMGGTQQIQLQVQINSAFFSGLKETPIANREGVQAIDPNQFIYLQRAMIQGNMEQLGRPITSGIVKDLENNKVFCVEWQNLWKPVDNKVLSFLLPSMTFKNTITPDTRLTGTLQLRIPALLSGLDRVEYISSLGFPVSEKRSAGDPLEFHRFTELTLHFDLALNKLPLSKAHVVTRELPVEKENQNQPYRAFYPVEPSPARVQAFLKVLSQAPATVGDSYIYIRSVVQDPKRVTETPSAENTWYWDITGNRFTEVMPVDFHIVIYGDEGSRTNCRTYIDVSVKGHLCEDGNDHGQMDYNVLTKTLDHIQARAYEVFGQEI